MKVLHVIDHAGLGGAQRVLESIIRSGEEGQHLTYVLNTSKKPYSFFEGKFETSAWGKRFLPWHLIKLVQIIRSQKITHIHAHLEASQMFCLALRWIFPKLSVTFHEHGKIVRSNKLYTLVVRIASWSKINFIAISHHTEKGLLQFADRKFVHYLPNPILAPTKLRKISSVYTIGFIARLIALKGWRTFIEAASDLPEYRFIIAGDGPDRQKIETYLAKNNIKNVELWGFVDPASKIFDEIDAFAFLSNNKEGMGLTHLEAVSVGIPVITTRTKATEEIFTNKESCLMIEIDDTKAFTEAVKLLSKDTELLKTIVKGGYEVYSHFSPDVYYEKLVIIYTQK